MKLNADLKKLIIETEIAIIYEIHPRNIQNQPFPTR